MPIVSLHFGSAIKDLKPVEHNGRLSVHHTLLPHCALCEPADRYIKCLLQANLPALTLIMSVQKHKAFYQTDPQPKKLNSLKTV